MNKKAVFFTVADPKIGLGHLFRCDALAYAMHLQHIDTELVVECSYGEAWLKGKSLHTSYLLKQWTVLPEYVHNKAASCDIPVFDAYSVSDSVWEDVSALCKDIVVFDDYGEKPLLKGLLINGSPGASDIGYQNDPIRKLLLGPSYQILRPPFWKKTERIIKKNIESVGVMLGGTDHKNLLPVLLEIIINSLPPSVTLHVIGSIEAPSNCPNVKVTGFLNAQGVKDLFDDLDILITAAGQTVAEAVSCALPVIILGTELNQHNNYNGWIHEKVALPAGLIGKEQDLNYEMLGKSLIEIKNYKRREKMCAASLRKHINSATDYLCKIIIG